MYKKLKYGVFWSQKKCVDSPRHLEVKMSSGAFCDVMDMPPGKRNKPLHQACHNTHPTPANVPTPQKRNKPLHPVY